MMGRWALRQEGLSGTLKGSICAVLWLQSGFKKLFFFIMGRIEFKIVCKLDWFLDSKIYFVLCGSNFLEFSFFGSTNSLGGGCFRGF